MEHQWHNSGAPTRCLVFTSIWNGKESSGKRLVLTQTSGSSHRDNISNDNMSYGIFIPVWEEQFGLNTWRLTSLTKCRKVQQIIPPSKSLLCGLQEQLSFMPQFWPVKVAANPFKLRQEYTDAIEGTSHKKRSERILPSFNSMRHGIHLPQSQPN